MSYTFGLHGPSMSVDSACSSSLVAVHYGVLDLQAHHPDATLAAGVNLLLLSHRSTALQMNGSIMALQSTCFTPLQHTICSNSIIKRVWLPMQACLLWMVAVKR